MTLDRRRTLGLFAVGTALLLLSGWLLQLTLAPRDVGLRTAPRKTLRAGRDQLRSEAVPNFGPLLRAGIVDGRLGSTAL